MLFAWMYAEYGKLPEVAPFIYGIKPAVIAIIISAVYRLGKKALKTSTLGILGAITLISCVFGLNEIIALFSCGLLGLMVFFHQKTKHKIVELCTIFIDQS